MKEKYILFYNSSIYYKSFGTGLPVVLLHGFGEDGSIWDRQVEFLKDKFLLIIPDLPGSGKSALIQNGLTGMDDYANLVMHILEAEKIDQCMMIGHSMGGYITLAFAEKYPNSLKAMGLFHSSAFADDLLKIETRKKAIAFIEANGSELFLQTSIPALFYDKTNSKNAETLIEKGKSFSKTALILYYTAMINRPDRTAVLRKAAFPVLFIIGEHDPAVPYRLSLEQCHFPKQSYIYVLRKSAHMGMLEETQRSNDILANFLLSI